MRRPDYFDLDDTRDLGCCPCCGMDLAAHPQVRVVAQGDGTTWCRECAFSQCACQAVAAVAASPWPRRTKWVTVGVSLLTFAVGVGLRDAVIGVVGAVLLAVSLLWLIVPAAQEVSDGEMS